MVNSPSQLILPQGGSTSKLLEIDPRPGMKILSERYIEKSIASGSFEKEVMKRLVNVPDMYLCKSIALFLYSIEDGAMTAFVPRFFLKGQLHNGREDIVVSQASNGVVAKGSVLKVMETY